MIFMDLEEVRRVDVMRGVLVAAAMRLDDRPTTRAENMMGGTMRTMCIVRIGALDCCGCLLRGLRCSLLYRLNLNGFILRMTLC